MDIGAVSFAVSGVETPFWLPPLVAFGISLFTGMVGISGAFLLLPFQMGVLHYTAPSVSATNLVFNLFATPGGIYRFAREGRLAWPLVWVVTAGSLPGVVAGAWVRTRWLADVATFKLFVGCVMLYLGWRLLARAPSVTPPSALPADWVHFHSGGQAHAFPLLPMFMLSAGVGLVGGIYGIGGGALIAPFCVSLFQLPVQAVAGAALAGTFATSLFGVFAYSALPGTAGMAPSPDWALGALFGIGGLAGTYLGARWQKHVRPQHLRLLLGVVVLGLGLRYVWSGGWG